jgi:GNAT superfamily N-acetyltransferase
MTMIVSFTPEQAEKYIHQLAELLIDAVDSGASVGFMPPLKEAEALDYWRNVIEALHEKRRVLLAALEGNVVQGSVQLDLETRANGIHRAEAMKLFVHRRAPRGGLAKALMSDLESAARRLGRNEPC